LFGNDITELEDMYSRRFYTEIPSRFACSVARWWRGVRVSWVISDKEPWVFALIIGLVVTIGGIALRAVFAYQDDKRDLARQYHRQNLTCLARNVYFEARGEPIAGQYAVAEVTMNRRASARFPDSVCSVVYEKRWDPIRKRYVGAFSWTELEAVPIPMDNEWKRAWNVAEAVYYQRRAPVLEGALYYHATHIKPQWAKEKQRVARIGKHIFYK
jgi:N-acetylmuramoyl-L-alanine amidase